MTTIPSQILPKTPKFHIVFFGYGGIGKSALIVKALQLQIDWNQYCPTFEDTITKQMTVDKQSVMFDILDTSGQTEYEFLRSEEAKYALNFVVGYSVDENGTDLDYWIKPIIKVHGSHLERVIVILVEYKIDLERSGERKLPTDEYKKYLKKWTSLGMTCEMIRVSVKENINVSLVFERIVRLRRELDKKLDAKNTPIPTKKTKGFSFRRMLNNFNTPDKNESKEERPQIHTIVHVTHESTKQHNKFPTSKYESQVEESNTLNQDNASKENYGRGRSAALVAPQQIKVEDDQNEGMISIIPMEITNQNKKIDQNKC